MLTRKWLLQFLEAQGRRRRLDALILLLSGKIICYHAKAFSPFGFTPEKFLGRRDAKPAFHAIVLLIFAALPSRTPARYLPNERHDARPLTAKWSSSE